MQLHRIPDTILLRSPLAEAVPQVVGVIIVVFLVIALGFVVAAYAEASARRIRPRIVVTRERPEDDPALTAVPFFLLALLVAVAILMDHLS